MGQLSRGQLNYQGDSDNKKLQALHLEPHALQQKYNKKEACLRTEAESSPATTARKPMWKQAGQPFL